MHDQERHDGARGAARAGRRHDVRGRGHRRRPPAGAASGEVVFNTVLSGYQEVITDPSYAGQIITFTYPHIGNYGVNADDFEARRPFCRGVVVRDLARRRSNWRSEADLDAQLRAYGVPGIAGIDTRKLTRHIRDVGRHPGCVRPARRRRRGDAPGGGAGRARHRRRRPRRPGHDGRAVHGSATASARCVVAYDFGIKRTILRHLGSWFDVEVVPASHVRRRRPRPGPRRRVPLERPRRPGGGALRQRRDRGAARQRARVRHLPRPPAPRPRARRRTVKLPFGHHGGNHPVRNLATGGSRSRARTTTSRSTPTRRRSGRDHAREPQRRRVRGPAGARRAGLQRAAPPRGRPGPARQRLPVRAVRRPCSAWRSGGTLPEASPWPTGGSPDAAARRHRVDPADRRRARS